MRTISPRSMLLGFSSLIAAVTLSCDSGVMFTGTVRNRSDALEPGMLVRLVSIDDAGAETAEFDRTLTDPEGGFRFELTERPGPYLVVKAEIPSDALRAFAVAEGGYRATVDAVSEGTVEAVLAVTAPDGERTLTDFTAAEIETIAGAVTDNLDREPLDLSDAAAVRAAVIAAAGRTIPDAAGGTISAQANTWVDPPDVRTAAPDLERELPGCGRWATPVTGDLFSFELKEDGGLCDAVGETIRLFSTYELSYELSVAGDSFVNTAPEEPAYFPGHWNAELPNGVPNRAIEDGREYVFGPEPTVAGLSATRKIFIPERQDLIRYVDIWENPTDGPLTVSIKYTGTLTLGTTEMPPLPLVESTGDRLVSADDDWVVYVSIIPSNINPTVGILWAGPGARTRPDNLRMPPDNENKFEIGWNDVTFAPGETKAFAVFSRILTTLVADRAQDAMEALYADPDLSGLTRTEVEALVNMRPASADNVTGEAGSVVSGTAVTASSGEATASTTAGEDGSFALFLDVSSGSNVTVESSDGWQTTVSVP